MERVLVIGKVHPRGLAILRARPGLEVEELVGAGEPEVLDRVRDADAILVRTNRLSGAAIDAAKRLKVVSRFGVGYDNVDLDALNAHGIPLTVVGAVNAVAVAEHTLFMLLAAFKRGLAYDRAVREGNWQFRDSLTALELRGRTLLVVGFGRIGREVASRARAFGMKIAAYDPFVAPGAAGPEVDRRADLDTALADADAVSLHIPLTPQTRNLFDGARLARMKPSSVLISTARGGLIDETALAEALRSGRLGAAALDVFAEEPPPRDHPLFQTDNVIVSPHSASLTEECAIRMAEVAARNCLDGLDGRLDRSLVVNPAVLERSAGDPKPR